MQKKWEEIIIRPIVTEFLPGSDYICGSQALIVERAGRSRVGPGALPGSATAPGRSMTNSAGAKRNRAPLPPALLTPSHNGLFSALASVPHCWLVVHKIHSGVTRVDAANHMASGMLELLGSCICGSTLTPSPERTQQRNQPIDLHLCNSGSRPRTHYTGGGCECPAHSYHLQSIEIDGSETSTDSTNLHIL